MKCGETTRIQIMRKRLLCVRPANVTTCQGLSSLVEIALNIGPKKIYRISYVTRANRATWAK